jgi:putative heme-binding domain-containing protein
LDALLHNIIDPNEVIGNGFEITEVELKDDTTVSGRVVEESDTRIKLLASGPTEHTIAKSDIKVVNGKPAIRKLELSLMPEGLEQIPEKDFRDMVMFLLNPPQDNRPWTPALRRELLGIEEKKTADASGADEFRGKGAQAGDGESVALWNPDWRVNCPPFEGAPKKLVTYEGRKNVLMTHPIDRTTPAVLERKLAVPKAPNVRLSFWVAADERGDWELRVRDGDAVLYRSKIARTERGAWHNVQVDLTPFAGRTLDLRLENAANDWAWEFGYWADIEVTSADRRASVR